jgi:hypothetical protein
LEFIRSISWSLLTWSGLVGLVLSSWLLMLLRRVGATRYLPRAYWSCALFGSAGDASLAFAGLLRMLALIAAFPIAYAFAFNTLGRAEALVGAIAGAVHGLLAGLALQLAARRCSGAIAPGFMGWNLGRLTPIVMILVHAVYGAALGYVYVIPVA